MAAEPKPIGRPPSFDRTGMLDAAVELIDRGGLESCTIRAVANEVGVTAMALYRRIDSKEHLLDQIPDHLVGGIAAELELSSDGIDALRRMSTALLRVLDTHPNTTPLFTRPTVGPNMAAAADVVIERLMADGYDRQRSGGLLRATIALIVGLTATGGESAESQVGPIANDSLEIWLTGVRHGA